ncbi:MAG TPA: hypothetical protein PKW07_06235 [Syntrophorhabdaceae bacterium]|nr:hypothetical protein [Syntrophorhabdaceae bacterium]
MKLTLIIVGYIFCIFILISPAFTQTSPTPQIDLEKQIELDEFSRSGLRAIDILSQEEIGTTAPPTPGEDAMGQQVILKRKAKYQPFSAFGNIGWNWTSNVALTKDNPQDDNYFLTTTGISYQPIIHPNLLGEITAMYQWFRYDRFTDMNFDSFNTGAGLTYVIPELDQLAISARYNYNRLTDGNARGEYYRNNSITLGLFKMFPLARAHYIYAAYSSQFGFSDPKVYQRDYHSLVSGYYLDITSKWSFEGSLRISYIPYAENGREDYNESVTLVIGYKPKPWININFSALAAFNQSNQSVFEYNMVNISPNISVKIKF